MLVTLEKVEAELESPTTNYLRAEELRAIRATLEAREVEMWRDGLGQLTTAVLEYLYIEQPVD